MFSKYDLHEAMKLPLGEWPMKPITPAEMRVGIARASYYSTIARQVSNMAECEGWTGEDKYTALAFHLMLRLEVLEDQNYRRASLEAHPMFLVPESTYRPELGAKG